MALVVIDDSTVGVQQVPGGGFAIQYKDISGFPEGFVILAPFEGETAETVCDRIMEIMGRTAASGLATATPAQAREEAAQHGLDTPK